MSELSVADRLKESLEVCELQRNKLKLCRLTMREHGIGSSRVLQEAILKGVWKDKYDKEENNLQTNSLGIDGGNKPR